MKSNKVIKRMIPAKASGSKNKRLKGFTLVELVIVIAIIGIMTSVAMPNMIDSVRKSKFNTAYDQARSIFNSAQTIAQKYEIIDKSIFQIDETTHKSKKLFSGTHYYGNISEDEITNETVTEFYDKLKAMNTHLNDCKWVVVIHNYMVTHVLWSEDGTDNYVGVYCGFENGKHFKSGTPDDQKCKCKISDLQKDMDFQTYTKENITDKWKKVMGT